MLEIKRGDDDTIFFRRKIDNSYEILGDGDKLRFAVFKSDDNLLFSRVLTKEDQNEETGWIAIPVYASDTVNMAIPKNERAVLAYEGEIEYDNGNISTPFYGKISIYADKITPSIRALIDE